MRPIIHIDPSRTDPTYGRHPDRTLTPYRPIRRGRPRPSKVVSFEAPGDMAYLLGQLADHVGVSTSEMVRRMLTVSLETPHLWVPESTDTE